MPPFLEHDSKDSLVVVVKDRKIGAVFLNLEGQPGVKTLPFDQLWPAIPKATDFEHSVKALPSHSAVTLEGECPKAEKAAVAKIEQLWLSCSPKISRRRSYISHPECRAITRLFNMAACWPDTMTFRDRKAIRKVLVTQGVSLSMRLAAARDVLARLQKHAMSCVDTGDSSMEVFESVDVILGRIRENEPLLKKAEEKMSEEYLAGLVKLGELSVLEKGMKDVEPVIVETEQNLLETKKMVDAVLRKCT